MEISFRETLALVKSVVLSPEVIGTAIVILLFLNMVFYVVSFKDGRKRRSRVARSSDRQNAPDGNISDAANVTEGEDSSTEAASL